MFIVPNIDFKEPIKIDRGEGFEDLSPYLFEYVRLTALKDDDELKIYLEEMLGEILALDDVHLSSARIIISDDEYPNAACLRSEADDPDHAIIMITKGLLNCVQNEDQLFGILGHEMGHAEINYRLGTSGSNSRTEEISADGLGAQWTVKTGRNWRATQSFLKRLASIETKRDAGLKTFMKVTHDLKDDHSKAIDRVQHVQTAVGVLALKEQCEIPEPALSQIPDHLIEKSKSISHKSYIDVLLESLNYDSLTPTEQLRALTKIDRKHYKSLNIHKVDLKDKKACKAYNLEYVAREKRRKDFQNRVIQALDDFAKEKQLSENQSLRDIESELIDQVVDTAGYYRDENARAKQNYGGIYHDNFLWLDWEVYKRANKLCGGSNEEIKPLGTNLKSLDDKLKSFISAENFDECLYSAQELQEELKTHSALDIPADWLKYIGKGEEQYNEYVHLFRNMSFPHFKSEENDPPWKRHLSWSSKDTKGAISEILWRIGINSERKLWDNTPLDQIEERARNWSFTQPEGKFSEISFGSEKEVVCPTKFEEFKRYIVKRRLQKYRDLKANIPEFSKGKLAQELSNFLKSNKSWAQMPDRHKNYFALGINEEGEVEEKIDTKIHYQRAEELVDKISECLSHGDEDDRQYMRDFFLEYGWSRNEEPSFLWFYDHFSAIDTGAYKVDSAFIKFVLDDPFSLFTPVEKSGIVIKASGIDIKRVIFKDKPERKSVYCQQNFGYKKPLSFSDIIDLTEYLDLQEHAKSKIKGTDRYSATYRLLARETLFNEELELFLNTQNKKILNSDFAVFARYFINNQTWSNLYNNNKKGFLTLNTRKALANLVDNTDFSKIPDLNAAELIDIYLFIDHENLFPGIKARTAVSDAIYEKICAISNPIERIDLLERFIFSKELTCFKPVTDFIFNEELIKLWAKDTAGKLGTDDGSQEYYEDIKAYLNRIDKGIFHRDKKLAFRALSDQVIAQSLSCDDIKNRLKMTRQQWEKTDIPVRGAELAMQYFRKSVENREDALDFLMQPEAEETVGVIRDKFITWLNSKKEHRANFCYLLYDDHNIGDEKLEETCHQLMQEMHRAFWAYDLEIRTLFLNYLLVPAEDLVNDPVSAYQVATDMAAKRLFRDNEGSDEEKVRSEWARAFFDVYLETSHETERSLILSALVSSAQDDFSAKKTQSFGQRLAKILGMMGPAYYKLGQAIHSHPETPEDIKEPMGDLKSMGHKRTRWDYLSRIERAVPKAMRDQFTWIGEIEGYASFFETGAVELKGGDHLMLALLKENAASEARHGFDRLEASAEILAKRRPEFAAISRTVIAMLKQARDLVDVETDLHLGAKQSMYMQEQCSGLKVSVDGHTFTYDPKTWRYYGDEFKLMDVAAGVHFDELPESTEEQSAHKKALAKANTAVKLKHILGGQRFDNDWHERQIRIDGNLVGRFDPGGMLLEKPSTEDKLSLVSAFKAVAPSLLGKNSKELGAAFTQHLAQIEDNTGSCPDYLMHVQKALLAQSGFHKHLDKSDFGDIFSALIKGKHIDPIIRNPLIFNMASWNMVSGAVKSLFKAPSVTIHSAPPSSIYAPVYIPSDSARVIDFPQHKQDNIANIQPAYALSIAS